MRTSHQQFNLSEASLQELLAKRAQCISHIAIVSSQLNDGNMVNRKGDQYESWRIGALRSRRKTEVFLGRVNAYIGIKRREEEEVKYGAPGQNKLKKEQRQIDHRRRMELAQQAFNVDPNDPVSLLHALWRLLCELQDSEGLVLKENAKFLTFLVGNYLDEKARMGEDGIVRSLRSE